MGSLNFTIDALNYTIPPDGYLVSGIYGTSCGVTVVKSETNDTIFGAPFLRNFFTVIDYSNNQILLAPTSYTPKLYNLHKWISVSVGMLCLILYILFLTFLYIWRNRRQRSIKVA